MVTSYLGPVHGRAGDLPREHDCSGLRAVLLPPVPRHSAQRRLDQILARSRQHVVPVGAGGPQLVRLLWTDDGLEQHDPCHAWRGVGGWERYAICKVVPFVGLSGSCKIAQQSSPNRCVFFCIENAWPTLRLQASRIRRWPGSCRMPHRSPRPPVCWDE